MGPLDGRLARAIGVSNIHHTKAQREAVEVLTGLADQLGIDVGPRQEFPRERPFSRRLLEGVWLAPDIELPHGSPSAARSSSLVGPSGSSSRVQYVAYTGQSSSSGVPT